MWDLGGERIGGGTRLESATRKDNGRLVAVVRWRGDCDRVVEELGHDAKGIDGTGQVDVDGNVL